MVLSKQEMLELYRKRARHYNLAVWLYRLTGFRSNRYRSLAVEALSLSPGDLVIDIGCGTGLNFPLIERTIKSEGQIIGVDLTDAMLKEANEQIEGEEWHNVELVQSGAGQYTFPPEVAGIISTLSITIVDEYDEVIRKGAEALRPGGRMVILELKTPEKWPAWLVKLGAWLTKPFGDTLAYAGRDPRKSIKRYLREVEYKEFYFGALYLSVGESLKK